MPARIPLYVRILGWFFLNVAVLGGGVWLALRSARTGEWFVMQQAEPQLQSITRLLVQAQMKVLTEQFLPNNEALVVQITPARRACDVLSNLRFWSHVATSISQYITRRPTLMNAGPSPAPRI